MAINSELIVASWVMRISKEDCSIQYASVSEVATQLVKLGTGTLMGKMDIQHPYHNILVDRRLHKKST